MKTLPNSFVYTAGAANPAAEKDTVLEEKQFCTEFKGIVIGSAYKVAIMKGQSCVVIIASSNAPGLARAIVIRKVSMPVTKSSIIHHINLAMDEAVADVEQSLRAKYGDGMTGWDGK